MLKFKSWGYDYTGEEEPLTEYLPVEWDHRSAEWIPSQSPAAADWWLYLKLLKMVNVLS